MTPLTGESGLGISALRSLFCASSLALLLLQGFKPTENNHRLFPVALPVPGASRCLVPSPGLLACVQAAALPSASLTWRPCHTEESGWSQPERAELSLPCWQAALGSQAGDWLPPLLGPCPSGSMPSSTAIPEPGRQVTRSPPLLWLRSRLSAPAGSP